MAAKGSLGVFIDSKTVYAAFASGTEQNMHSVPVAGTPEDLDYDAKITDAVRTATQQIAPSQKSAYLAVPGESAMVRCFELPVLPKKEESAAIRFEAQKYVPFELRELCYDYDTVPDAARKRMSVLFYAGKKSTVERLLACVEAAGLSVSAVELLSNSLARSFNQEIVKNSGAFYMLVRMTEDQAAEMIIAKNQTVLLSRHVTLDHMPSSAQWNATSFLAELRLSLDYFDDIFKGQAISKIYVSAPFREDMQALTEAIHRAYSITVEAVSSTGGNSAAGLAVAHGLALRESSSIRGKKVNLKPATEVHAPTAGENKTALKDFAMKALMAAAAILVGSHLYFGRQVQSNQDQLRKLTTAFPPSATTPVTATKDMLVERQADLNQRLDYLAETIDRRRYVTLKLNALAKLVPQEIRLLSLAYDDDVTAKGAPILLMRIEGYVPAEESAAGVAVIGRFVSGLQADKDFMNGFAQIKLTSTKASATPSGKPAVRFELECASAKKATI